MRRAGSRKRHYLEEMDKRAWEKARLRSKEPWRERDGCATEWGKEKQRLWGGREERDLEAELFGGASGI